MADGWTLGSRLSRQRWMNSCTAEIASRSREVCTTGSVPGSTGSTRRAARSGRTRRRASRRPPARRGGAGAARRRSAGPPAARRPVVAGRPRRAVGGPWPRPGRRGDRASRGVTPSRPASASTVHSRPSPISLTNGGEGGDRAAGRPLWTCRRWRRPRHVGRPPGHAPTRSRRSAKRSAGARGLPGHR